MNQWVQLEQHRADQDQAHRLVVEGGDPIYPEDRGGLSAAAARVQRPRESPWARIHLSQFGDTDLQIRRFTGR